MPERRLYQELCETCSGSGQTEASHRKKCHKCEGQGWILGEEERALLCPDCNGDGDLAHTATCRKCDGRGFEVRIVEIYHEEMQCQRCNGTGQTSDKCSKCKGTGVRWILRHNFIRPEQASCTSCGSTGKVAVRECGLCDGKGQRRIEKERPIGPQKRH